MINIFFNKKIKLILRSSETNKKIQTIKFSSQESFEIRKLLKIAGLTEQEFFNDFFHHVLTQKIKDLK
jgi:hypothetical protein